MYLLIVSKSVTLFNISDTKFKLFHGLISMQQHANLTYLLLKYSQHYAVKQISNVGSSFIITVALKGKWKNKLIFLFKRNELAICSNEWVTCWNKLGFGRTDTFFAWANWFSIYNNLQFLKKLKYIV